MSSIDVDGATLDYTEAGSGNPVVFVHGSASDRRTWDGRLEAFADGFRVIAYSRRHHFPNVPIAEGASYSLNEQVDDLAEILRRLDANPAHLVGHSYGGLVCLELASRAPDLVRSLVLMEPPAMALLVSIPPKPSEIFSLALRSPRTALSIVKLGGLGLAPAAAAFERGDAEEAMRRMGTAILGRRAFAQLSDERAAQVRDNLIKEELLGSEAMPPLDARAFARIRTPVLLVGGRRSPRVFARMHDHLESILPNVRRVEIPDASHLMHEDAPTAFDRALRGFLSERETPCLPG